MRYVNVDHSSELPDVSRHAPFKAVVAIDRPVHDPRQAEISRWLVRMGCRYVIAFGDGCESWRDSVRAANVEIIGVEELNSKTYVMTTTHPYESPRSVLWFAKHAAKHPEVAFEELVVLHLADSDRSGEFEVMYQKA